MHTNHETKPRRELTVSKFENSRVAEDEVDLTNAQKTFERWIHTRNVEGNLSYADNRNKFIQYDKNLAALIAEISNLPFLVSHFLPYAKRRSQARANLDSLISYIEKKGKSDPLRTQLRIRRDLLRYRPDLIELETACEKFRYALKSEQRIKNLSGRTISPNSAMKSCAKIEQLCADTKQIAEGVLTANMKIVYTIAKKFEDRGLPMLDLVSRGSLGLYKAIQRFEIAKGNTFYTYAVWWVRQSITRAIAEESRTIRIPVHKIAFIAKVNSTFAKLSQEFERAALPEEVADELGVSAERVLSAIKEGQSTVSLDQPIGDDGSDVFGDHLRDENAVDPSEGATRQTEIAKLYDMLDYLKPHEKDVLILRFGLAGREPQTLEQIGEKYSRTRERIRQIEAKAKKRLQKRFGAELEKLFGSRAPGL